MHRQKLQTYSRERPDDLQAWWFYQSLSWRKSHGDLEETKERTKNTGSNDLYLIQYIASPLYSRYRHSANHCRDHRLHTEAAYFSGAP